MNRRIGVAATAMLTLAIAAPAFAQSGADTFKTKCAMCHAPDGTASSPMGKIMEIPSFRSPEVGMASDASLIVITKDGKGKMPAYNGKLSAARIREAVSPTRMLEK